MGSDERYVTVHLHPGEDVATALALLQAVKLPTGHGFLRANVQDERGRHVLVLYASKRAARAARTRLEAAGITPD